MVSSIHRCPLSWASCAYFYCTLTLLFGDGLAAIYNDRRGQPEMQQAMDNAPVPPVKNGPFPPGQDRWYPALLTHKTSTLLSEALHMLRRIKDVGEREWVEAFIHRLGNLAADLQQSKSTKVPVELQPSGTKQRPLISRVITSPSASKFNKAEAKYQVTSAQVNDVLPVNEGQMNRQVVTKPSLLSKVDDDLVFQLHSQDSSNSRIKSKFTPTDGDVTYHTKPIDSTVTEGVAPATTPLSNTSSKLKKVTHSEQKVRETLLSKLLNEIDALKHQNEAEKEVRNLLKQMDNHHIADFTNPQFSLDKKHSFFEDEFEIEEDEGAAAGELSEDEEPLKNTISPSWQQVMEAASEEARYPEHQEHQSIKEFAVPIPTMSEEMERQLRDGEIVVLSDKIVKTNFQEDDKIDSLTQSISASQGPINSTTKRSVSNKLPESHSAQEK